MLSSAGFWSAAFWSAAFWTALLLYRGAAPLRLVVGLLLGAVCAHLGWAGLHAHQVARPASTLVDPRAGYSVLFLPLGVLCVERSAAALRTLPAALAVARLGCLAAGCCGGTPTSAAWASSGRHPVPLLEVAGWLLLHRLVAHLPERGALPVLLVGFGGLRLLLQPLRADAPLGSGLLAPELIAGAWVLLGGIAGLVRWLSARGIVAAQRRREIDHGKHHRHPQALGQPRRALEARRGLR